jgi:hypothetical protein
MPYFDSLIYLEYLTVKEEKYFGKNAWFGT